MRPLAVLTALVLATLASPANANKHTCHGRTYDMPAGVALICSATWQLEATCDGSDQWDKIKIINGPSASKDSFIRPFEKRQIIIRGLELLKINGKPTDWWMIGSGFVADAWLWIPPGGTHARRDFPSGTGVPWPGTDTATPTDFFDLHGSCSGGGKAIFFFTVTYSVETP